MKQTTTKACIITLAALLPLACAYKNVYGNELQSCSQEGMALTGYTRTGYCVDKYDDSGSHHICIDLSSLTNGDDDGGGNFCQVTGQSDWCSSEMPCHEDRNEYCPVQNWCVCQWAFASYIQKAGGCDEIQDIVCESVNLEALKSYARKNGESKYRDALSCVTERCGVKKSVYSSAYRGEMVVSVTGICLFAAALLGMLIYNRRRQNNSAVLKEQLVNNVDKNYGSSTSSKVTEIT